MEKWTGKVAIVTGASSGIGAATAKTLVKAGMKVVGLARRKEQIDLLSNELQDQPGQLYAFKADMTKEEEIVAAFKWTTDNVGPVSVLINNAGVLQATSVHAGDAEKWRRIFDTNFFGVAIASREAVRIMRENDIDGYIININSIVGHGIFPSLNMYPASKHALKSMTETLRLELANMKSNIRVTSLSPGVVNTDIFTATGFVTEEGLKEYMKNRKDPVLASQDIADAISYLLSTPLRVQVTELIIKPLWEGHTLEFNCEKEKM